MVILRVAMGRAWRKETVNEINTGLVFAGVQAHNQSQDARTTIFNPEDPKCGPGMPGQVGEITGPEGKHISIKLLDVVEV